MYKVTKDLRGKEWGVRRLSDGAEIPADPSNMDWQEYLRWVDEGNEPEPAEL